MELSTHCLKRIPHEALALASIVEVLAHRAAIHPAITLFRFLDEDGEEESSVSYGELWRRASAIAAALSLRGERGDRVALFYPAGLEFIAAFLGCLLARRIAVPLNLPTKRRVDRCLRILDDCDAHLALTQNSHLSSLQDILDVSGSERQPLQWLSTSGIQQTAAAAPSSRELDPEDIAFLQYTSGSTSHPKGVMVSHRNIATNLRMMRDAWHLDEASTMVFWQPHHHDMGLILGQLLPILVGNEAILMGPNTFVRQPLLWLLAISRYKAVLAGGPNFAYDLCVDRYSDTRLANCDLSSWKIALNGADVVRSTTLERFAERYGALGYRPETMLPCYGLAEATLFVSGGPVRATPRVRNIDTHALEYQQRAIDSTSREGTRPIVACGLPSSEIEIAVVCPETLTAKQPDEIGEIWIASPANAQGYWRLPDASRETFSATLAGKAERFMRSGDLGFVGRDDGQLYLCGRLKDLIISDGRNIHPEDIEYSICEADPHIKAQSSAVFEDDRDGERRIIAVIEADRELKRRFAELEKPLVRAVRRAVAEAHGITLHEVVFIAPTAMRKTTSGKIQRGLMRRLYQDGSLERLICTQPEPASAT